MKLTMKQVEEYRLKAIAFEAFRTSLAAELLRLKGVYDVGVPTTMDVLLAIGNAFQAGDAASAQAAKTNWLNSLENTEVNFN